MSKFAEQNTLTNYMVLIPCNYTELKPIYGAVKAAGAHPSPEEFSIVGWCGLSYRMATCANFAQAQMEGGSE